MLDRTPAATGPRDEAVRRLRLAAGRVGPLARGMLRPRRWPILAIVLLLLAVPLIVYTAISDAYYPADEPVRALFAALAARDSAAVAHLTPCEEVCAHGGLARGYEPPTQAKILGTRPWAPPPKAIVPNDKHPDYLDNRRPDKDQAVVEVRYQLGGQTYDEGVVVCREPRGGLRKWGFCGDGLLGAYLNIPSRDLPTAQVAGATVSTMDTLPWKKKEWGHWVPLGIYTVTGVGDALWDSRPVRLTVEGPHGNSDSLEVRLDLVVKPSAVDEVNRLIHSDLDRCATTHYFKPGCGFGYDNAYMQTQDVRWKIDTYPKVDVVRGAPDLNEEVKDSPSAEARTTVPGRATITFSYSFDLVFPPTHWTSTSATVDIRVSGGVYVDQEKIVCHC
jgi:hypothetical protein